MEAPNVIGMSQFADGAYVNRMSNHCKSCSYDVKHRTGPKACPLGSLYRDFPARHEEALKGNQRLWRWRRFSEEEQVRIRAQAAGFLATLA